MAISLNSLNSTVSNHATRITNLEGRSPSNGNIAFYRGTRNGNIPVYNLQNYHQPSWITRNSNGTFTINTTGVYMFVIKSYVSWYGDSGQTWVFKLTLGSTVVQINRSSDDYGHGNATLEHVATVSAGTVVQIYFAPSRGWHYIEPSYFSINKIT